jgi:hypothetical protein
MPGAALPPLPLSPVKPCRRWKPEDSRLPLLRGECRCLGSCRTVGGTSQRPMILAIEVMSIFVADNMCSL